MKQVFIILSILSIHLFGQTSIPDTNDYSLKIKEQTELIEKNTVNWQAYYTRGNLKLALKEYNEAIKDYDRAIEIHAKNSEIANAFNNRGAAKNKLGYYSNALLDYKMAISLSPNTKAYRDNYKKTKEIIIKNGLNDNYYAPWHQKIKDTSNLQTVSKGSFYLFGGFGVGVETTNNKYSNSSGVGSLIGCSIAYKSHLLTFDRVGVKTINVPIFSGEKEPGDLRYRSNYIGADYLPTFIKGKKATPIGCPLPL